MEDMFTGKRISYWGDKSLDGVCSGVFTTETRSGVGRISSSLPAIFYRLLRMAAICWRASAHDRLQLLNAAGDFGLPLRFRPSVDGLIKTLKKGTGERRAHWRR